MLTLPYVTVAAFRAHPTFLDSLHLRPGDSSAADQDAELRNVLLMASAWADNYVEMSADGQGTLTAHVRTESARLRLSRDGTVRYRPDHHPVTAVTALSYGYTPGNLTPVTDFSNTWIEKGRTIVSFLGYGASLGPFQFGPPLVASELYTTWTYTAGYANTLLAADAVAGATSIQVADATGVAAGTVLRLWDPGVEEAVTVAAGYTSGTTLPLTAPLANAHTAGAGVSALPPDVHLAVILYAAALLQRPDSEAEDTFPSTQVRPNARVGGGHDGSGLVTEAERLLEPYRRVR